MLNIAEEFEKYDDEFLNFELIENPMHPCPDVCAFLMLNKIAPMQPGRKMISASAHDEYYLDIDIEKLAENATTEQIRDLHRCGIRYESGFDCLCIFA